MTMGPSGIPVDRKSLAVAGLANTGNRTGAEGDGTRGERNEPSEPEKHPPLPAVSAISKGNGRWTLAYGRSLTEEIQLRSN
jgi:hypothetical protein